MIRAIIQAIADTLHNVRRFTASGRPDETITDREFFQQYGFSSSPQPGAEGIVINNGNHYIMIATEDRRYRIPIVAGEVCIYTDEGDNILFQRGKQITVTSGNKIVANAANEADVTAPVVNITAATSVTVTSPTVTVNASTQCEISTPLLNLSGDRSALRTLVDDRLLAIFNGHTHPDAQGGNTGTPSQALTEANTCTSKVMGA
ncbi:MAG: phage baseplate assembly protein [Nitrospiraceae bacterium]|nr:phage baseplate assembly protein [Nitrospiraceae bacterium]